MKTATVHLKVDKIGNSVWVQGVTPAELMFLVADNHVNAGGDPVLSLKETEEVEITPMDERVRLSNKYGGKRVGKFYPGSIPTLPQDFDEARQGGLGTVAPTQRLLEVGG